MRKKKVQVLVEDPLAEWLAWLMDESIAVGPWKVGLDGFIGLIPGIGDIAGAGISAFIIGRAMQAGISRGAITRMIINMATDSLVGSLPVFGDIFDFAYKSNIKNVQIYREALRGERAPVRDWAFIILVILILVVVVTVPLIGLYYLAHFIALRIG
jgi:hypothetical protein